MGSDGIIGSKATEFRALACHEFLHPASGDFILDSGFGNGGG